MVEVDFTHPTARRVPTLPRQQGRDRSIASRRPHDAPGLGSVPTGLAALPCNLRNLSDLLRQARALEAQKRPHLGSAGSRRNRSRSTKHRRTTQREGAALPNGMATRCGQAKGVHPSRRGRLMVSSWLTYAQAARYTGWSVHYLRNLVSAGQIPVYGRPQVRRQQVGSHSDQCCHFLSLAGTESHRRTNPLVDHRTGKKSRSSATF